MTAALDLSRTVYVLGVECEPVDRLDGGRPVEWEGWRGQVLIGVHEVPTGYELALTVGHACVTIRGRCIAECREQVRPVVRRMYEDLGVLASEVLG